MKKMLEIIKTIGIITIAVSSLLIATSINNKKYDVNNDGVVDSADLLDIRLYLLSH